MTLNVASIFCLCCFGLIWPWLTALVAVQHDITSDAVSQCVRILIANRVRVGSGSLAMG